MAIDGSCDEEVFDCNEVLKALAHPLRRAILAKLKDPELHFSEQQHPLSLGVCAGLIEQGCPLAQSSASAHLAALQAAGLLRARKIGTNVFYQRNEQAIRVFLTRITAELTARPARMDDTERNNDVETV